MEIATILSDLVSNENRLLAHNLLTISYGPYYMGILYHMIYMDRTISYLSYIRIGLNNFHYFTQLIFRLENEPMIRLGKKSKYGSIYK